MASCFVLKNILFLKLVPQKFLCGDKNGDMSYYVERVPTQLITQDTACLQQTKCHWSYCLVYKGSRNKRKLLIYFVTIITKCRE